MAVSASFWKSECNFWKKVPPLSLQPDIAIAARAGTQVAATAPIIESLPSIRLLLAQYPFNSLHNWHFEILFIVAIIIQLTHIALEALYTNNPVVAFGMI